MNREQYIEFHKKLCEEMVRITHAKNSDYSSAEDPFQNFRVVEAYGLSAEQGFITRMSDKMSRLANFIRQGEFKVKDESFIDTCLDLANYSVLLAGYYMSKQQNSQFKKEIKGQFIDDSGHVAVGSSDLK